MARVKLALKKIKNKTSRHITYSKRKSGLVKKAYELSTLCDVEVALICFSPSGKLTLFEGKKRIEEILSNFIDSPTRSRGCLPDEQLVRQLIYKLKLTSGLCDNNSASSSNSSGQNEAAFIEARLEEVQKQIWFYSSKLEDVEKELQFYLEVPGDDKSPSELEEHEKFLEETLLRVRMRKSVLEAQQTIQPTGQASSSSSPSFYGVNTVNQPPLINLQSPGSFAPQASSSSGPSFYGVNTMNQPSPVNIQFLGSFTPSNEFYPLSNGLRNLFGPSPSPSTYLDGYSFPTGPQMNHELDQAHNSTSEIVDYSQMVQMYHEPSQIPSNAHNLGSVIVNYSSIPQMNNEPHQIPSNAPHSGPAIVNYSQPPLIMQQAPAASSSNAMWNMGGNSNGNGSNLDSCNWFL